MSMRNELIESLRSGLMGPKGGVNELLSNPRAEYVVGVLSPDVEGDAVPSRNIDDDMELTEGNADDGEEDEEGVTVAIPVGPSPALDPRLLPRSLGVSFQIHSTSPPVIHLCATWARYLQEEEGGPYRRHPLGKVVSSLTVRDGISLSDPDNICLQIRAVPHGPDLWRIRVYFINTRKVIDGGFPLVEDHVFQPQIRILVGEECQLEPLPITGRGDIEDQSLELQFSDHAALGRGHLCAAVWKAIDPERPLDNGDPSPFTWTDAETISEPERNRFALPDLRTEFLPLYPVCAPSPEWDAGRASTPLLSASSLAQCNTNATIRAALQPLVDEYSKWIGGLTAQIATVLPSLQPVARQNIANCIRGAERIQRTINILADPADSQPRLAFCFANQAIALQNRWRRRDFHWRPFQLAFFLIALTGIALPEDPDRDICDLLWFPTGGGKTEAYLGLIAFTLGLRRLRAPRDEDGHPLETGLGALSRYTLRLLTIQQFRRALGTITACETLRVQQIGGYTGWRPDICNNTDDYLWGATRFSAGLWAGQGVTPNQLHTRKFRKPDGTIVHLPGANDILSGERGEGEPAQIIQCPCCDTYLALGQPRFTGQERAAFPAGSRLKLHLTFYSEIPPATSPVLPGTTELRVLFAAVSSLPSSNFYVLTVELEATSTGFSAKEINSWWRSQVQTALMGSMVELACTMPSRPGYFLRYFQLPRAGRPEKLDFEVYCPNPECELGQNVIWREKVPIPINTGAIPRKQQDWQEVIEPFQSTTDSTVGARIPIPAKTVDEQIYNQPPSLLVATVDKFARLAYKADAAALFGYVRHFERHLSSTEKRYGYTRYPGTGGITRSVQRFLPPDLILQDELHLIDGPLGSMVGLYETAIEALCEFRQGDTIRRPKYIASTATVRAAAEQVKALFNRELKQFPPPGLNIDDSFFAVNRTPHPADITGAGRVYFGVSAPGRGAQTPLIRIWGQLLQSISDARGRGVPDNELDPFWTLVGYFNAIRELAGAAGLYRQDIPQWIRHLAAGGPERNLSEEAVELSSRMDSLLLPAMLSRLDIRLPGNAETAVLATSMFGTGVDISRLGLMYVHGQPKTTAAYIQATGRVGREIAGLVVTFLRASRPRDLDHYEFFTGYHSQLYRSVEPVTVAPFSPRARDRALGPIAVVLLRQAEQINGNPVSAQWGPDSASFFMAGHRADSEVEALKDLVEARSQSQPMGRLPRSGVAFHEMKSELDRWQMLAHRHGGALRYFEYALQETPTSPVVLGDPQHLVQGLDVAYENAPQSLREVEPTTGFKV